jgi:hypothetical protein
MSAALAAVFKDHEHAETARTALVNDGFATDRVALTSLKEPGPVELVPAAQLPERLAQYFTRVFDCDDERTLREHLVRDVLQGAGVLVVQPRGSIETDRALRIFSVFEALAVHDHDLANRALERAASPDATPIIEQLLSGSRPMGPHR